MKWWQVVLALGVIGSAERYVLSNVAKKPAETPAMEAAAQDKSLTAVQRSVAVEQSHLPLRLTDDITIDEVSYSDRTVHYHGTSRTWFAHTATDAGAVGRDLRAMYCVDMRRFVRADVSVEFDIVVPPQSLDDRRSRVTLDFTPQGCIRGA